MPPSLKSSTKDFTSTATVTLYTNSCLMEKALLTKVRKSVANSRLVSVRRPNSPEDLQEMKFQLLQPFVVGKVMNASYQMCS